MKTKMIRAAIAAVCVTAAVPSYATPTPENTPDYFVEWVRARSNLHVDTGIMGKIGVKAEISFYHTQNSGNVYPVMLGAWGADNERLNLVMYNNNQCRWEYGNWDGGKYSEPAATGMGTDGCSISATTVYGGLRNVTVECRADGSMESTWSGPNGISVNATMNASGKYGLVDTKASLFLFASHRKNGSTDGPAQCAYGYLRFCKLWTDYDGTGTWTPARDLLPCVKDGRAGLYDSINEEILYPQGNALEAGSAKFDSGYALGSSVHPATQWGRISYAGKGTRSDGGRDGMGNSLWMHLPLTDYTAKGVGDVANLNGQSTTWQKNNLAWSQLRFDGWFQVSSDKAGVWSINQKYDDYFAIFIDNANVLYNNSYTGEANATVTVTEGWHRFTIIAGDTYGGYGSNKDYGTGFGRLPFRVTVNGTAYAFNAANFPQGSGSNVVTLNADADWSDRGALLLNGGTVLDLNGHTLTVHDIACDDYLGSMVTNSAAKKSVLLFSGDPAESNAYAEGLIKGVGNNIILAKDGELTAVWTGVANDGGVATNPNNWQDVLTEDPVVPTAAYKASTVGTAVNLQIPAGSTFTCKSFDIGNCTLTANCDWTGLAVTPTISGTANLAGHVLTLPHLAAIPGSVFSGVDGSAVAFIPDESAAIVTLTESTFIDDIANLSLAGGAKILFAKKAGGGTLTVNNMLLGTSFLTELSQSDGTVNLGNTVNKIGSVNGKTGVYRINGGTVTTGGSSEFVVGSNGRGEVVQTAGDVTLGNWFSLGRFENGNGTYTITGGTLKATKGSRPLWISGDKNSTGTFNIGDDAVVTLDAIKMCAQNKSGMNAYLNVNGNGRLNVNNYLRTSEGDGTESSRNSTITQGGGVIAIGSDVNLGGACGTAKFTQTAGTFTAGSTIYLGDGRSTTCTATMNIGGTVNANSGICIANRAPATGTLMMSKGGVLNTTRLYKGAGKGYIKFDGGKVAAKQANAGFISGIDNLLFMTNAVTIDSAGYNVVVTNTLYSEAAGSRIVKEGAGRLTFEKLPHVDSVVVSNGTLAVGTDCDNAASASLAHRWSFSSDLTDSITGKAGTKYGSGSVTYENGTVKLPGGAKGTCYIDLGAKKLPSDSLTIEMWMTLREQKNWTRGFVIGGAGGIVFNTRRSDNGNTCNFDACGSLQNADAVLANNTPYYVAISFEANGNGGVTVRHYGKADGSDNFLWSKTFTKENWSVMANVNPTEFWLGHSTGNDEDTKADFDEVRVWRGALSPDAITLSAAKGPDATAADIMDIVAKNDETVTMGRSVEIISGATLDLGGHTLVQPIVKGNGTITTGVGGQLVVSSKLVAKVGESIEASGTIDLTNAKLELSDPANLAEPFTFLKPVAGQTLTVTGVPTPSNLPKGWKVSVSSNGTGRIVKRGMMVIVR